MSQTKAQLIDGKGSVDLGALSISGSAADNSVNIDSSSRLLVGTSSSYQEYYKTGSGYAGNFAVARNEWNAVAQFSNWHNSSGEATVLMISRSRGGSIGTHGVLSSGDGIGALAFNASDGSNFRTAALIEAVADAAQGSGDVPARLVFSTTADGASNPTERMRLSADSGMRLASSTFILCPYAYNTTSASAANLIVGSDGNFFRSTSSARYKTDIETIQNQYADVILDCRPVWYRSTCEKDNPNWGYWGFIAEEVAEVDPRLVFWKTHETVADENGNETTVELDEPVADGVQYDRFVPHLLSLIKRQKDQIEAMEARLSALEGA